MAAPALARHAYEASPEDALREIIRTKSYRKDQSFKLSSGVASPYFFDMKRTMLDPEGATLIADIVAGRPELKGAKAIGGLAMGAVPIVSVVCARSFERGEPIPGFFVRRERKGHGTDKKIDGCDLREGDRVVLVDDVTTTGGSVMLAINAAREVGCVVDTVITLVDRLEGAKENLRAEGIELVAIFTRDDFDRP